MKTRVLIGMLAALLLSPFASAQSSAADPHMAKALELRARAETAFGAGDYDSSAELARMAKAELALVPSAKVLPSSYTVRLIPEERDSLSKIAGYPFVYGDRSRWVVLYRANKDTLKHPGNADMLLPGEVLVIPSIADEKRAGAWRAD
jgi:nucleoid-associated protein YgaU